MDAEAEQPVPDVTSLEAMMPKLLAMDTAELPAALDRLLITDERRATIMAVAWSRKLGNKPEYNAVLSAMLAARQLYITGYIELQNLLAKETPEPDHMAQDMMVMSVASAASKPFDVNNLIALLVQKAMPWVGGLADDANVKEQHAVLKEMADYDKARRATPLAVGFRVDPDAEDSMWPRDRSLVLVGWAPAVNFVIDQIVSSVLASRTDMMLATVVRLQKDAPKRGDEHVYLIRLGQDKWKGISNSSSSLPKVVLEYLAPQMTYPADLIVCDDLVAAHTKSYFARPPGAVAGDAHKRLKDWAKKDGAGLVAGVPLGDKDAPDTTLPEWEQIRTFAALRRVRVIESADNLDKDKYRIMVGLGTHYWEVDKAVLDGARTSSLILPSDL